MKREALVFGVAAAAALSCGEVPTLDGGIAYISPIVLPAPAIAIGDTLRDGAGNVTPLAIRAFGRNGEELATPAATFLPTRLPSVISIDGAGIVTASDTVTSVQTVQITGRVGNKLQTTMASLLVVPQPDSLDRTSSESTQSALPAIDTLRVTVTGVNGAGTRVAVPGIIVNYRITGVFGSGANSATAILALDGGTVSRPDSTVSADTTDASGLASRTLVVAGTGVDSVVVFVRARSLRGVPLRGDSLHFVLRTSP